MKLCIIAPIKHLKEVSGNGDFLFCLSRQAMENDTYRQFFTSDKHVILDNSIHEDERLDDEKLVNLALHMGVKELIIPDVMGNANETKILSKKFLDKYAFMLKEHDIKLVGVIQGKTLKEIVDIFIYFNNDERIDYLALPFDLTPFDFTQERNLNQMFNRLYILQYISSSYKIKKQIHALGLNSLLEIKLLDAFPMIRSCDSKILSRLALSNIKLDENNWVHIVKPVRKMDFFDEFTKEQLIIMKENIEFIKKQLVKVK